MNNVRIYKVIVSFIIINIVFCFYCCDKAKANDTLICDTWHHVDVNEGNQVIGDDVALNISESPYSLIKIEITNIMCTPKSKNSEYDVAYDYEKDTAFIFSFSGDRTGVNYNNSSFSKEFRTSSIPGFTDKVSIRLGKYTSHASFDIKYTKINQEEDVDIETDNENDDEDDDEDDEKTSGKIESQRECMPTKCKMFISTKSEYSVKKIRLYRKDSKNGKYKLVRSLYDGSDLEYERTTDKGLKPNKQYWYKVKTLGWHSKKWSDFSPAKSYWTSPEKVTGKKLKGNVVTWKKTKGVLGYIVDVETSEFVGYNIFGDRLYDNNTKSYFVNTTKYIIKDKNVVNVSIRGYTKHYGRYYTTAGEVSKKKKSLKYHDYERYRF